MRRRTIRLKGGPCDGRFVEVLDYQSPPGTKTKIAVLIGNSSNEVAQYYLDGTWAGEG